MFNWEVSLPGVRRPIEFAAFTVAAVQTVFSRILRCNLTVFSLLFPRFFPLFCSNLELASVSETHVCTILILLMFSIVLAHQRETVARAPPTRSGAALGHPWPSL